MQTRQRLPGTQLGSGPTPESVRGCQGYPGVAFPAHPLARHASWLQHPQPSPQRSGMKLRMGTATATAAGGLTVPG